MANPDEAVKPQDQVESKLISEAQQRHELAKTDTATDQEKKQAAVEQAHALSTRPDGSYAQLHETDTPTVAVADKAYKAEIDKQAEEAVAAVTTAAPTPADKATSSRRS